MPPSKGLEARRAQIGLMVLLALALASGMAAVIVYQLIPETPLSTFLGIAATAAFIGAIAWARDTEPLPVLHQKQRAAGPSRAALDLQVLRVASVLLNLLMLVGLIVVVLALLSSSGATDTLDPNLLNAMATVLDGAIVIVLSFTLFQSLRTEHNIPRSPFRTIFSILFLGGSAALGLGAIGFTGQAIDAVIFLGSGLFAALAATAWRNLPTLYTLATEERAVYHGGDRLTRTQSTIMPALMAFALLFVVLLLFILFGASAIGDLAEVVLQPSFIILVAIMLLAIAGSVGAIMLLSRGRKDERVELFEEARDDAATTRRTILYTSLGVAGLLVVFSVMVGSGIDLFGLGQGRWIDLFTFAVMVAVGPYGFYAAHESTRIRRMEERFPDFLRDIASSHRGGLTLPNAVKIAARGDYSHLTPEVERMADQLSWNVSFTEALQRFADRVATPLVRRAVNLVQEAGRSGGSTSDVLLAAARDARQIKNMENERRLSMTLYGVIIYITFFVFLLVASVLFNQFVPQILASAEALEAAGAQGSFQISVVSLAEYRAFYFLSAVVQGVGGGIVAGMMANGKAVLGLRHAFIMTAISFITFVLFLA